MSTNTTTAEAPRDARISSRTRRAGLSLCVRLRRARIDRDLAEARLSERSEEHALRAAQLASEVNRRAIARSLRDVVAAAENPRAEWLGSTAPLNRDVVLPTRAGLMELVKRLGRSGPIHRGSQRRSRRPDHRRARPSYSQPTNRSETMKLVVSHNKPSMCWPPRHRLAGNLTESILSALAALTLGLVGVALLFSSPASAQTSPCSEDVMSAPTGPATVSVASTTSYGRVLVVGSGDYAGCSLYLLTSDQLHALSGADFACSDNMNLLGTPCDSDLWPALLTKRAPIAGPGVNPRLLGTVTRTDFDLPDSPPVKQVTYAGYPLYRFFLDEAAGDTQGANLDDPVPSPPGIRYLVDPSRGTPATGRAQLQLETAPVGGTGPEETVLAARMNNDFSAFPDASFPVYALSQDHGWGHESACQGLCAVYWPPLLTSELPEAGLGVDQHALGIIVRPDGSHQVTYNGRPLYLFNHDAYIGPIPGAGTKSINGAGAQTPWGVFNTIPPLP